LAAVPPTAGVPVRIDRPTGIAHYKSIEIDDDLVPGGSFNDTAAAQTRNAQNMALTRSAEVAAEHVACWNGTSGVSQRFVPA
jgi:phosphatidylserine/phosphatidylglycerophosphate/cardiolipin synthase-like enzyme